MRVLFVVSHVFYSEPLGAMQLSAICKQEGHDTRLAVLSKGNFEEILRDFAPDVIGYSTMTSNMNLFIEADLIARDYIKETDNSILRIMGGPHPTYFTDVLLDLELDAIVCGDGDLAMISIMQRAMDGENLEGIPNVIPFNGQARGTIELGLKEVIENMDMLPFMDRDLIYDAMPDMLKVGIRSFMTQRGCPYKCTYCFNHSFNKMFKGDGRKLLRRRSVDNVIAEVKQVVENFPEVRFIRFADDVFVIRQDAWLDEFVEKFPKEIGLPFYCLIRANSLSEETAAALQKAGCRSVGMSIEAGTEELRNTVLKRNMTDDLVVDNFNVAKKYKLNAYANTMLGLPGTTLEDDYQALKFARRVGAAAPTFGIFCPYPKTELTELAKEKGILPEGFDFTNTYRNETVLTNYTAKEKSEQLRLSYLAPLFTFFPDSSDRLLRLLVKLPLTTVYSLFSSIVTSWLVGRRIFPGSQPRDPIYLARSAVTAVFYFFDNSRSKTDPKKKVFRQFPSFESTEVGTPE
jgi:anaerobic magnesium-protoporphyrin IX monomethyl ester cyclase